MKDVTIAVKSNKPHYPVLLAPQRAYLLINVTAGPTLANLQAPLNFSMVVDCSGSMAGEKIRSLRQAVKLAIDQMTVQDHVSVITFNEKAEVVVASQMVADHEALKRAVGTMNDGGGTSISEGMKLGLQELTKYSGSGRINHMLLLTDGQTYGDEKKCIELSKVAGSADISISALGLGDDWNTELLGAIARYSGPNGVSDRIDHPQDIPPAFLRIVRHTQARVLTNAALTLRTVEGVKVERFWQALPLIAQLDCRPVSNSDVQVTLADMNRDDGIQLLAELRLPPRQPGLHLIAQASISYDVPLAKVSNRLEQADVSLNFTVDQVLHRPNDPTVNNVVEKVVVHRLQVEALQDVDAGNIQGAAIKLGHAATRLLNMGEDDLATTFLDEADNLKMTSRLSDTGEKILRHKTQKLIQRHT